MAENDIYNSEGKYERFKDHLEDFLIPPENRSKTKNNGKYYCKNKVNLTYFRKLFDYFDSKDLSYVRRNRLLGCMNIIVYATEKDLAECQREDINKIVAFMHVTYKTPKSKADFIKDIKYLWRILFPEKDEKGREDEKLVPYTIRHLSATIDRSKEKLRGDKLTFQEFDRITSYFSNDARMQCYLTLAMESLGRPQELLYVKISDLELNDSYAKVNISSHGKEGCGFLQCIDSYPYLIKWLEAHPFKKDKNTFLFINLGNNKRGKQLKPGQVNHKLKIACKDLKIEKPVTCYSIKRNGVTFRRLNGESDVEIQHAARWRSTKQLKTYDMSDQEDALRIELTKRGIIKPDKKHEHLAPQIKICAFCSERAGFAEEFCPKCRRPLDRENLIKIEQNKEEEMTLLKSEIEALKQSLNLRKPYEDMLAQFFQNKQVQQLFKQTLKIKRD